MNQNMCFIFVRRVLLDAVKMPCLRTMDTEGFRGKEIDAMRRTILAALITSSTLASALAGPRPAAAAMVTYLSLGDSVAFGETDFTGNPSFGDRGYDRPYADS